MPRSKLVASQEKEGVSDADEEFVDTTAILELRSRRLERKQKKQHQKMLEGLALAPILLLDLPPEVFLNILLFVRPSDIFILLRVSKALREFILGERNLIAKRIIQLRYMSLYKSFQLPRCFDTLSPDAKEFVSGTYKKRQGFLFVAAPPPDMMCECVTCSLRWFALNVAVDFAHWQPHLEKGEPIPTLPRGQSPAWAAQLLQDNAAVVCKASRDLLWHARLLEKHLASTTRSIRRHEANKGNKRPRFLLTEADERSGTDAFLEREGPPTTEIPYHRDNYYLLEAYLPSRAWSSDKQRWVYIRGNNHDADLDYTIMRWKPYLEQRRSGILPPTPP